MELCEILKLKDLKPAELVTLIRINESKSKKVSQEDLAQQVGVSKATMHRTLKSLTAKDMVYGFGINGSTCSYSFKPFEEKEEVKKVTLKEKPIKTVSEIMPIKKSSGHEYSTKAFRDEAAEMAERDPNMIMGGFRTNPTKNKNRKKRVKPKRKKK